MLKTHLRATVPIFGAVLSLTAASGATFGQSGSQFALEEITVTARRVEENLMTVPLAIAAVPAAMLEDAGIRDLNTLSAYTPGLWAESGVNDRKTRQLTFRGLSVSTGLVFVDGAPYAGQGTPNLGDVARVEVLVGPQSVYFGRSTFQGAVNFVTKDPGDQFKGQIRGLYAQFNTTDDQISLEGPIVRDRLGVRMTARHYATGGQYTNATETSYTLGEQSSDSLTTTMVFNASDNLKAKLLLDFEKDEDGAPANMALKGDKQIFCQLGGAQGSYYCGQLPDVAHIDPSIINESSRISPRLYDILINNSQKYPMQFDPHWMTHFGFKQIAEMAHLNLDYTMGGWNLSSVTALHKTKAQTINTMTFADGQALVNPLFGNPAFPTAQPDRCVCLLGQDTLYDSSQELRLTSPQDQRLRATAGGNYAYVRQVPRVSIGTQQTGIILNASNGTFTRVVSSTPAVFAGVYYDIVDKLTVSGEARYQWDKVAAQAIYPVLTSKLQSTFTSFSPRATLDYKYAPDSVAYALWSRGYRPGGFNASVVGQPAAVLSQLANVNAGVNYAQEKLDNFEVGLKSTWLDRRVRTTIDAYYDKWRNGQVPNSLLVLNGNQTVMFQLTTNVGAVDLKGIEAEGEVAVSEHLTVHATLNYQTSKIINYVYTPSGRNIRGSTNVNGNRFQGSPDWTWTLSPSYTAHLAGDWDWFGRVDYRHRGKYMIDPTNVAWIGSTDIVDLRAGAKTDRLMIEGFVTNLTDNSNFANGTFGNDALSSTTVANRNEIRLWLPSKRSFGIRASYSF